MNYISTKDLSKLRFPERQNSTKYNRNYIYGYLIVVGVNLNSGPFSYFSLSPARSYILDLTPTSKIINEFSSDEWTKLLTNKCVKASRYHHEIETITNKLFGPVGVRRSTLTLMQARQRWKELNCLPAPSHNDEFSYSKDQWEKILWWAGRAVGQFLDAFEAVKSPLDSECNETEWKGDYVVPLLQGALKLDGMGEISVLASQDRRNHDKDVLVEAVDRAHLADLLCQYESHEIVCLLACGGPYNSDVTKPASDEFQLQRMMKDMLDALHIKFYRAKVDGTCLYVLGIQTYLAEVRIYLMEKRDVY
ncbi:hypothetical protein BC938DRAFT_480087, partial [Jimgerdemannia flammicorona]